MVASTVPNAGAGAVATTANVVVNFSEPVSVAGAWYAISCTVSNAHTAVVTGGPTSYTLNPDADFVNFAAPDLGRISVAKLVQELPGVLGLAQGVGGPAGQHFTPT